MHACAEQPPTIRPPRLLAELAAAPRLQLCKLVLQLLILETQVRLHGGESGWARRCGQGVQVTAAEMSGGGAGGPASGSSSWQSQCAAAGLAAPGHRWDSLVGQGGRAERRYASSRSHSARATERPAAAMLRRGSCDPGQRPCRPATRRKTARRRGTFVCGGCTRYLSLGSAPGGHKNVRSRLPPNLSLR